MNVTNLKDNLCKWNGVSLGWYEVWQFTLNHLASGCGFSFRYTVEAPSRPKVQPAAIVWGFFFDPAHPEGKFGVKMAYPIDYFEWGKGRDFILKIGNNFLGPQRARGEIQNRMHRIGWDLAFRPTGETFYHLSTWRHKLIPQRTVVCSPNLNLHFNGDITVDGKSFPLQNEPGCQSHIWGRKHAEAWARVHANAFEKEKNVVFEGLAARTKFIGNHSTRPVSSLFLKYHDEEFRFDTLRAKNNIKAGTWGFEAHGLKTRLTGTAACANDRMLQIIYEDPDGATSYCANSEIADLQLQLEQRSLFGKWTPLTNLHAKGTAHLEFGSRTPLLEIPTIV